MHACVTFLLGWTELRLRRGPARAVELLRAAERESRTCGQEVVRRRATANLALALALEGALGEARRVLDPVIADGRGLAEWTSADAGVEWLTDGFLSYWTNDLERAQRSLRVAAACTDDPQSVRGAGPGLRRVHRRRPRRAGRAGGRRGGAACRGGGSGPRGGVARLPAGGPRDARPRRRSAASRPGPRCAAPTS
jgi:hypothetical protein